MKRVHFRQWVPIAGNSSHHEGKEEYEWHSDMTDEEYEAMNATAHLLRSGGVKVHIVKVEEIENGNG